MRKRILIGLLAIAVIGVVAFFFSQPKKGSVEWHEREYWAASERADAGTWKDRAQNIWNGILGKPKSYYISSVEIQRAAKHERALIELGFLERRTFFLTNVPSTNIFNVICQRARTAFRNDRIFGISETESNGVAILAPREDMPKWEELIRKIDVPESGK